MGEFDEADQTLDALLNIFPQDILSFQRVESALQRGDIEADLPECGHL